jgi:cell fate regulator YaaT (PSP1 superfamily)
MGCSTGGGCASKGCSSGGCNRLNTYDWISALDAQDVDETDLVEVSFKNGSRKAFYHNPPFSKASTGDMVVVDTGAGFDIGKISLSGELVRLQLKKKRVREDAAFLNIIRKANERDMEKLLEVRQQEKPTMIKARVIARSLKLDMKLGDVEFQADGRKATFYYTADGRVDFRELIKQYAKDFRVKIEMRQIGARQESARLGGIGSCGRELCCSTWLSDFKSVTTAAARYQNLAINQAKLSGQCGRLKCCLNYELDLYMDVLDGIPEKADKLYTLEGTAILLKTDIFKGIMYYVMDGDKGGRQFPLKNDQVKKIQVMNQAGEKPATLSELALVIDKGGEEENVEFTGDVHGVIELPPDQKKKKKKKKKPSDRGPQGPNQQRPEDRPAPPRPPREPRNEHPGPKPQRQGPPKPRQANNAPNPQMDPAPKGNPGTDPNATNNGSNPANHRPNKRFNKFRGKPQRPPKKED